MRCEHCGSGLVEDAVYCPRCCGCVDGASECDDYAYEAFISYRHLPADRAVAVKVQKALEGFAIPRHLREQGGPARLGKLFRDEDELPTSSSLPDQIGEALRRSRFLIVVCSPQTNESAWVQREVELFASYHGREKIRIALVEGEPEDSFPLLLRTRLTADESGNCSEVDEEPLAADFRDLSRKHFKAEILRLAAPMIGCGFDDLRQRQKARRMRMVSGIASAVAAASVAFGAFSFYQQAQIAEHYRQVQIRESEFLASESAELLASGDRYQAIQVALAALPNSSTSGDRPFVPAAQLALENALGVYPTADTWQSCYSFPEVVPSSCVISQTGLLACNGDDDNVHVLNMEDGLELCVIDASEALSLEPTSFSTTVFEMAFAGDKLICSCQDVLACFDAQNGDMLWRADIEGLGLYSGIAVSNGGDAVAVFAKKGGSFSNIIPARVELFDAKTGALQSSISLESIDDANSGLTDHSHIAFNGDDSKLALGVMNACVVVDLASGDMAWSNLAQKYANSVTWVGEMVVAVSCKLGVFWLDAVSVEAFDETATRLWRHDGQLEYWFNEHGVGYTSPVEVCGTWPFDDRDREQIVVMFDKSVLFMDPSTGEIALSYDMDAPFASCAVMAGDVWRGIVACALDGSVIVQTPQTSEQVSQMKIDKVINTEKTGVVERARIIEVGGSVYLIAGTYSPNRLAVFKYVSDRALWAGESAAELSGLVSVFWGDGMLLGLSSNRLAAIDTQTFEPKFTIDYDSFEGIDVPEGYYRPGFSFSNGRIFIFDKEVDANGNLTGSTIVYIVSADNGAIIDTFRLHDFNPWISESKNTLFPIETSMGENAVLAFSSREIRILYESDGHEERIEREGFIEEVWSANGRIIVFDDDMRRTSDVTTVEEKRSLKLLDLETGEEIASDLTGCELKGDKASNATMSGDGERFVAELADGSLCMFDVADGSLLWRSDEAPSEIQCMSFAPDSRDVLLQDASGRCMLVSGDDGLVLNVSSVEVPPIQGFWTQDGNSATDKEVISLYQHAGLATDVGIVIFCAEGGEFSPMDEISGGLYLADDGLSVLTKDEGAIGEYHVIHRYSLDELISLAHDQVAGHELTGAEKHLYRIE